jgi:hypothetical protein
MGWATFTSHLQPDTMHDCITYNILRHTELASNEDLLYKLLATPTSMPYGRPSDLHISSRKKQLYIAIK